MDSVRHFSLEILRHGPSHNQLLSPLTPYMALCGSHGAETVHVPFEHYEFLERLKDLRYQHEGRIRPDVEPGRRQTQLQQTAEETGRILGHVPGLVAELARAANPERELIHLRLVISASELALLPFELATSPGGCPGAGEPLFLQSVAPITITREVRRVGSSHFRWPRRPRILFAAASPAEAGPVPFDEHLLVLRRAIDPWVTPYDEHDPAARRAAVEPHLTVLPNATLADIQDACASATYTHVHLLAHGQEPPQRRGVEQQFGLALHRRDDPAAVDVVDGRRLSTALRAHARDAAGVLSHPAVVTIASCDSGQVGSVVTPGASLAHYLHQAGIPLVLASQFPLSFAGSVLMTQVLYERLLRGEDPRLALHNLRWQLHALNAEAHDWASLVAYAALPDDLETQLQECRFLRAKEAVDAAMDRADWLVDATTDGRSTGPQPFQRALERLDDATHRLPPLVSDEVEGIGLRASIYKRKAQLLHRAADEQAGALRLQYLRDHEDALGEAADWYRKGFFKNMSSHWNGVQYLSLCAVLDRPLRTDYWTVCHVAAERDLDVGSRTVEAWAHASLAELYLLHPLLEAPVRPGVDARERALHHAQRLLDLAGRDDFAVFSTLRQFKRYLEWWTINPVDGRITPANAAPGYFPPWHKLNIVSNVAQDVVLLLKPPRGDAD